MSTDEMKPAISSLCCLRKNKSIYQLYYIIILIITCARGQIQFRANLESSNIDVDKQRPILQDSSIFVEEKGNLNGQTQNHEVNLEQIYDENFDPIRQGMTNERNQRERQETMEYDTEGMVVVEGQTYHAKHETIVDREIPDVDPGSETPCARGKACVRREESRGIMIEALKRNILMQLKMKEPPNITVPKISFQSPPLRRMIKKYRIKLDEIPEPEPEGEEEEDETKKEKVISYAKDLPFGGQSGVYFSFTEEDTRHSVKSAVISVFIKPCQSGPKQITLDFIRYQPNATHPDAPPVPVKLNQTKVYARRKGHWKSFSILEEVKRWFQHPEYNLGIDIRSPDFPELIDMNPEENDLKPMLDVDLGATERSRRKKRDLGSWTCDEHSNEQRCCKYRFEINFGAMGWDWIINPKIYRSYYCAGLCSFLLIQTNQNKVMTMNNVARPENASPCCAPTKMSSMSLLYFDNDQRIIYSEVPDMIVDRCGCM